MIRFAAILAVAIGSNCQPAPPEPVPPPQPPIVVVDAAPGPLTVCNGDPCACACLELEHFGCPEGKPTPRGQSCSDVCQSVNGTGFTALPAGCVAAAKDVAGIRLCGVACK